MEMVYTEFEFSSLGGALHWYNQCNPARSKSINLLEREGGYKEGRDPTHSWAYICSKIWSVLNKYPGEQYQAFRLVFFGDRTKQWAPEDVAKEFHIHERTVKRWIRKIWDNLEDEFINSKIIPPRIEEEKKVA